MLVLLLLLFVVLNKNNSISNSKTTKILKIDLNNPDGFLRMGN